jgi:hypothetical protein
MKCLGLTAYRIEGAYARDERNRKLIDMSAVCHLEDRSLALLLLDAAAIVTGLRSGNFSSATRN